MNKKGLSKRQKHILTSFQSLGGEATTRQIAAKADLHVNGVSQSLGSRSMSSYVRYLGGKAGETKWALTP